MICPECFGEKIKGFRLPLLARGKIDYDLTCKDCGHSWRRGRGTRTMHLDEATRKRLAKDWENVDMEPNRLEQLLKKRAESVGSLFFFDYKYGEENEE